MPFNAYRPKGKRIFYDKRFTANMMVDPAVHHPTSLNVGNYYHFSPRKEPANLGLKSASAANLQMLRKTDGLADAFQMDGLTLPKEATLVNTQLYNTGSAKDQYNVKRAEDEWNQLYHAKKVFQDAEEIQNKLSRQRKHDTYKQALDNQVELMRQKAQTEKKIA